MTWTKFPHSQAAVACGSFTVDTATLRRYYILFFIHIETRQIFLAGQTANPSGALLRRNPVSLRQLGSSAWCGSDKQVHTLAKERIVMVNEAGWERVARVVLGVVLLIVGFGVMDGTAGVIVGIVAFVPLLTGLSGWCPLYSLFGFRTNKTHSEATAH